MARDLSQRPESKTNHFRMNPIIQVGRPSRTNGTRKKRNVPAQEIELRPTVLKRAFARGIPEARGYQIDFKASRDTQRERIVDVSSR